MPPLTTRAFSSVLVFSVVVALIPRSSHAEQALAGVELYDQARFEDALEFFEELLSGTDASTAELATAHLYVATLLFIDGDAERAARHAAAATALNPAAAAPPGAPAGLARLLRAAAAEVPAGGMELDIEAPRRPVIGRPLRVHAVVSGAPDDLVSTLELRCEAEAGEVEESVERDEPETELTLPTADAGSGDEVVCVARTRMRGGALLQTEELAVSLSSRRRRAVLIGVGAAAGGAVLAIVIASAVAISRSADQVEVGTVSLGHQ